jgi:hypothetical protein
MLGLVTFLLHDAPFEQVVIFIIKTATNMMAADGNKDGFLVQRAVQARNTTMPEYTIQSCVKNTVKVMPIL